jgi:hypothetical protein
MNYSIKTTAQNFLTTSFLALAMSSTFILSPNSAKAGNWTITTFTKIGDTTETRSYIIFSNSNKPEFRTCSLNSDRTQMTCNFNSD